MHQKGRLRKHPAQQGSDKPANPEEAQRHDDPNCRNSLICCNIRAFHVPSEIVHADPLAVMVIGRSGQAEDLYGPVVGAAMQIAAGLHLSSVSKCSRPRIACK